MLLGFHTNSLVHHRLDDALRLLRDEGFEAVALTPDVGHLDPFRSSRVEVRRIAALLRETGLTCVVETGARYLLDARRKHRPNLLEDDPGERRVRLDFLRRCLHLAADLGAAALSFWAGRLPDGVAPDRGRARLEAGIEALLSDASRVGVPLAFEPEPGMLVATLAGGLDLLDRLGNPARLGLTLDVGHIYVTGEGPVAEVVPAAAGRILQVHVEDMRRGVHEHLPPGDGDVDFPEIWRVLAGIGYAGPVCFELGRSSHAAPRMLRLARTAFEAGGS